MSATTVIAMTQLPIEFRATSYEVDGRSAIITLNRPHRGNAWTGRMHAEYRHRLVQAENDDSVRVIIVTGAGDKFCVGGDAEALSGHASRGSYDDGLATATAPTEGQSGIGPDGGALNQRAELQTPATAASLVHPEFEPEFAYHFGLSKPVLAALNGAAAGIGLALACFADLRFAVSGAKLTTAHGKLALPPEYGLSWLLPRQVGLPRALDLLLTSRLFSTDEAYQWGLITELAPADELMDRVVSYAEMLAQSVATASLEATRHMVYRDLHRGVGQSVAESLDRLDTMMGTADYKKGVDSLRNRQAPQF